MHLILCHAVSGMRAQGPTNNYQTSLGEGLHPQHKTDYRRSNKQSGWEDQVCSSTREGPILTDKLSQLLHKEQERCVILKICERVNQAHEQPKGRTYGPEDARVRLASPQKRTSVGYVLSTLTTYLKRTDLETALHRFVVNAIDRDATKAAVLDRAVRSF